MAEWDNVIDDWYDQALANGQGFKSEEEKKAYLDSLGDPLDHPMFATSAEQIARHPLGDAFRLLKEEDKTAYELAVMYKDEGNEFMRGKTSEDYRNAIDKYDQALPFVDQMEEDRKTLRSDLNDKGEKDEEEDVEEIMSPSVKASQDEEKKPEGDRGDNVEPHVLRSQIISNKAAAHLGLKNYRSCITECDSALGAWQGNMKAYFRKAKSLSMLRKFHEVKSTYDAAWAAATGDEALSLPNDLQALYKHANVEIDKEDALRKQVVEQQVRRRKEWGGVWDICQQMGVSLGFPQPRDKQQQQLKSVFPFFDSPHGLGERRPEDVRWPLLFLYPQYNELDVVQAASTDDMLAAHLAVMFPEREDLAGGEEPVQWDALKEYQVSKLVTYVTFDGVERIQSEKEWKEGYSIYYGEKNEKDDETKWQQKWSSETSFCEVHMGCTLGHILRCSSRHVTSGGLTTFMTFARGNLAHKKFLKDQKRAGYSFYMLEPGAGPRESKYT